MTEGKITKFKVEKKPSRMVPAYSMEALEKEVEQRYENARLLEQKAQEERAHARKLEQLIQKVRSEQTTEVTYVDVKDDD